MFAKTECTVADIANAIDPSEDTGRVLEGMGRIRRLDALDLGRMRMRFSSIERQLYPNVFVFFFSELKFLNGLGNFQSKNIYILRSDFFTYYINGFILILIIFRKRSER